MAARRAEGEPTFTEQARRRRQIESTIDLISTKGHPGTSLAASAGM